MIKGDHDKLAGIARYNVCAVHKTPLEVAWHSEEKSWVLRCGHDHYPDAVTRQLSLTQEVKAGAVVPEPIKSNIVKGAKKRMVQQGKTDKGEGYGLMPAADLGTGTALAVNQVKLLEQYAGKSELDLWLGHVVLMYGKPYITIDGYLYHARKSGTKFSLEARPLTAEEQELYKLGATDHGWLATVTFTETGETFTGLGVVTQSEMEEPSKREGAGLAHPVVAAHPWHLGQKRAEWQALRRAFPIGGE